MPFCDSNGIYLYVYSVRISDSLYMHLPRIRFT